MTEEMLRSERRRRFAETGAVDMLLSPIAGGSSRRTGQVLATSENYASKQSAKAACESVRKSAGSAHIVDLT